MCSWSGATNTSPAAHTQGSFRGTARLKGTVRREAAATGQRAGGRRSQSSHVSALWSKHEACDRCVTDRVILKVMSIRYQLGNQLITQPALPTEDREQKVASAGDLLQKVKSLFHLRHLTVLTFYR